MHISNETLLFLKGSLDYAAFTLKIISISQRKNVSPKLVNNCPNGRKFAQSGHLDTKTVTAPVKRVEASLFLDSCQGGDLESLFEVVIPPRINHSG
jgi:hypothetical protein